MIARLRQRRFGGQAGIGTRYDFLLNSAVNPPPFDEAPVVGQPELRVLEHDFFNPEGFGLPADGFLPSKEWKEAAKGERWFVGDTYHLAIGQGDLLSTPLQLAAAGAVLANGGRRVTPHVIERVDGVPVPVTLGEIFDAANIAIVRQGMRQAVTSGSARFLSDLPVPVAGKTGTAQPGGNVPNHAWFLGFGPYQDPTLTVVVLLENGGEGSSVAVPLAKEMFAWWFAHRAEGR